LAFKSNSVPLVYGSSFQMVSRTVTGVSIWDFKGKGSANSDNLVNSTNTFVFTSALTSGATYLYDENDSHKLSSVASSDTVSEVWEFEFTGQQTVTAFQLANHNIKDFTIKYWSTTAYVTFTPAIAETINSATYNYYDNFNKVTSKIQLTMNKTIVADQEKSVGEFRVLNKIGEMSRNPKKADVKYPENSKIYYTDSKENVTVLFGVTTRFDLEFKNLPSADIDILETCKYLGSPFYVWLAPGGNTYARRGWRIEDITLVNYTNAFDPSISDNLMANGEDIKVTLEGVKPRNA